MNDFSPASLFCQDSELGYERSRTQFASGEGLILDETYRLAHLPLVAPDHPRVIRAREGSSYDMGRHERVFSLVLPISGDLLFGTPAYRELNEALREAPFAHKIAWDLLERRKDKLHATICGSLSTGEPHVLDRMQRQELARLGPIHVELRGLFSGSVNRGRLYLRAYPESRHGENVFRHIQRSLGCRETDLYVVGVYNMTDDLDAEEAAALASLIDRWWDRAILQFTVHHLWLMGAYDDLVLDSTIAETVSLV
ncbi:hypothetical protein VB618_00475 [Microvirga sp. CF3062]|uniref:hypothetical protein n=1 Tax=Microvirga sp. CF3062 TaxID=3110182 RepID=UPI002E7775C3|nr:hypothetical protein [Microvirga sp. CF3062]MEE1654654.1 hypothetical protein [Microvirga sp. CF3062]